MKSKILRSNTGKILAALITVLFFYLPSFAQSTLTVSGTVIDSANNEPIIGASVMVAGTNTGAQTDVKGNFTLNASTGATLSIKYIGYNERRIVVSNTSGIVVKLAAVSQSLKEVVVLAYGSQRKADITSAVSQVDLSKSQGIPASNAARLLQGQAPGVVVKQTTGQPGRELQVEIRGNSSLGATSDPLYVVDGFPVGNSVGTSLNANDIESITVLKDAASTSVYGSRGANGVVLITTKNGKKDGHKLTVSTNTGIANVPDSRRVHVLNGREFAQFKKDIFIDKYKYDNNGQ
ncbi:MAG: TonB-dependent receptor, partial [Sphingobacteriaceae bacterium]